MSNERLYFVHRELNMVASVYGVNTDSTMQLMQTLGFEQVNNEEYLRKRWHTWNTIDIDIEGEETKSKKGKKK